MSSLCELSDQHLVERLDQLEGALRRNTAQIVAHLAEMERRRLHLRLGYSSLYDYCTNALALHEHEAYRRMAAAQLALRFPPILDALAEGTLQLTSLSLLRPHLTAENSDELLKLAENKSKRDLVRLIAARFPNAERPEKLRREKGRITPTDADHFRLEVFLSAALCERWERALDRTSHRNPARSLAWALEQALDAWWRELERELLGALEANLARPGPRQPGLPSSKPKKSRRQPAATSRHVPLALRRAVFERDGERCTFVGSSGRRCEARRFLELDHVEPWSLGGPTRLENLRVLCRSHNRLRAEEFFGSEWRRCTREHTLL